MNIYTVSAEFGPYIDSIFNHCHRVYEHNAFNLKQTVIVEFEEGTETLIQHRVAQNLPTKIIYLIDEPLNTHIINNVVEASNKTGIPLKDILIFCCWMDPNKTTEFSEVLEQNNCTEVSYIVRFPDWRAHHLNFLADLKHSLVAQRPNRMLCLTGSMEERAHRFHTIYYMYKNQLLKDHTVSALCLTKDVVEQWQEKYSNLDYSEDFVEVAASKQYPADNVLESAPLDSGRPVWVCPPDPRLYDEHSFTYICESSDGINQPYLSAFFSEKTLWPIMYKHPFVLQASPGHINYIKKLGFETFDSIINTDYNLYDNTKENFEYVENTVLAAKNLYIKLNNPQVQTQIQDIVDYNFNNLVNLIERHSDLTAKSLLKFSLGHRVRIDIDNFY